MMKYVTIAALIPLLAGGCAQWVTYTPESTTAVYAPPTRAASVLLEKSAFTRGFEAIKAGNYAAAEPLMAQALREKPEDPYALLAMGTVMEQTERPTDAIAYYRLASRYGTVSPLGETVAVSDTDAPARTVGDLALRNIQRLDLP